MMKSAFLLCVVLFAVYVQAQLPPIPPQRPQTFIINKANYALWWYGAITAGIRFNATPGPLMATRSFAIVTVAIHDTVNAFNPVNEYYLTPAVSVPTGADIDAAIAGAGFQTMMRLYPNRIPDWSIIYRTQLSLLKRQRNGIRDIDIRRGFQFGRTIGEATYSSRINDGAAAAQNAPYTNAGTYGLWVPTPPTFTPALGATWGSTTPWVVQSGAQFRPAGPIPFSAPDFQQEYTEIFFKGPYPGTGTVSTRTPLETYASLFFAVEAAAQSTPPGQYMETAYNIAQDNDFSRADTARFVALTALAQADATITAWETKYFYNTFRPINAIHNNTNSSLPSNPNWLPLLEITPPFPDYISGHSTIGGAVTRIWQNWFNSDTLRFRVKSDTLPGVIATYNSFSQYSTDNAFSRIWAGVHFRRACADGVTTGEAVADWVWTHALRPLA